MYSLFNYSFQGRARRKEFWMFQLYFWLVLLVLFGIAVGVAEAGMQTFGQIMLGITGLFYVIVMWPSITVAVRRLHDTGRSGLWCFILAIPAIGPLIFLALMCIDGQPYPNDYGDDPKGRNIKLSPQVAPTTIVVNNHNNQGSTVDNSHSVATEQTAEK